MYGPQILQFARKIDLRQFDHTISQVERKLAFVHRTETLPYPKHDGISTVACQQAPQQRFQLVSSLPTHQRYLLPTRTEHRNADFDLLFWREPLFRYFIM
jgi:hypothetical protein